jgi:hypothetical protein
MRGNRLGSLCAPGAGKMGLTDRIGALNGRPLVSVSPVEHTAGFAALLTFPGWDF